MEKYHHDTPHKKNRKENYPHKNIESHKKLDKRKNKEKKRILKESKEKRELISNEVQLDILEKTMTDFIEKTNENLFIRKIKANEITAGSALKKGLDENLDQTLNEFEETYSKIEGILKTVYLDETQKGRLENLLNRFGNHILANFMDEKLNKEAYSDLATKSLLFAQYIKERRNNIYVYVRRLNKDFVDYIDEVYYASKQYDVPPDLIIATIQNETFLGKRMASENNFGNINNTDAGKRVSFETPQDGINALAKSLKKRIDRFKKQVPDRNPTVAEIFSGVIRGGKRFYAKYMSNPKGPSRVESFYSKMADTIYVTSNKTKVQEDERT